MLAPVLGDIRKYRCLRYIALSVSLYGDLVAGTISKFCEEHSVSVDILKEVPSADCLNLFEICLTVVLVIGEEVGLICYNDFPLNEFILGGLTTLSTDFTQMGRTAAKMILSGTLSKVHCPCALIRRNTF